MRRRAAARVQRSSVGAKIPHTSVLLTNTNTGAAVKHYQMPCKQEQEQPPKSNPQAATRPSPPRAARATHFCMSALNVHSGLLIEKSQARPDSLCVNLITGTRACSTRSTCSHAAGSRIISKLTQLFRLDTIIFVYEVDHRHKCMQHTLNCSHAAVRQLQVRAASRPACTAAVAWATRRCACEGHAHLSVCPSLSTDSVDGTSI